ncbi:MAG: hypothetical protein MK082_02050 [Phycisphaerales bacterium]|nr:hypothetical protein [Phycisphaerales bacterium]
MNHHDTRTNCSSPKRHPKLGMLVAGMLAACILATAGAGATKTRFDLDRSRIFKQVRLEQRPPAVEAMIERWVAVVPPWHQEILKAVPLPVTATVPANETDDDKQIDTDIVELPIVIMPTRPITPERSHDGDQEVPEISDHGGWEEVIFHPVNEETSLD